MIDSIGELKTAIDIIKGLKPLFSSRPQPSDSSTQAINDKLMELQNLLLTTQGKQFEMAERMRGLEAENRQHKEWAEKKKRYEFRQLSGANGETYPVYTLKEEFVQQGEVAHRLCAACYETGKKSILSFAHHHIRRRFMSYCPTHEWGNVPLIRQQP